MTGARIWKSFEGNRNDLIQILLHRIPGGTEEHHAKFQEKRFPYRDSNRTTEYKSRVLSLDKRIR
jgi:hypothetical protein